jgi:hypothetical protein
LATSFQLIYLAGLWAYLEASKISRKSMALILTTTFFSGLNFINSFYTWPKLLPVAFLLVIAAYLLTDRYYAVRSDWRVGSLTGAAAAFGMLCHGGSAFGLVGIAVTLLLLHRVPSRRFLLAAASTAIILYLPWSAYQKYYDPPGDRLLKSHLAGTAGAHPEAKLGHLLIANYSRLHLNGVLEYKAMNFSWLFDRTAFTQHAAIFMWTLITGDLEKRAAAVASLRYSMFLHWLSSIDLFIFTPVVLLLCIVFRRRGLAEFQQAWRLLLCTAITVAAWCLLMFGPATTIVHQGCYFTEVAAFAGGTMALWALSRKLAVLVTACHVVFNLAIYVLMTPPRIVGFATFMGPLNPVLTCACILASAAFVLVLWSEAREST